MALTMNQAAGVALLLLVTGCAPVDKVATSLPPSSPEPSKQALGRAVSASSIGVRRDFVARVVGDNEDVWNSLFSTMGYPSYPKAMVVIFSGRVNSSCGFIGPSVGPFYCKHDRKIYIDTAYFSEPSRHFDASGDFAAAFLIAHEFGHHIQNVLGAMPQTDAAMSRMKEPQPQQMRVLLELQADCYAGIWSHFLQKRNFLESGDIEQGLPAAFAVGDPLTNGRAVERHRWFQLGFATGDPRQCETTKTAPR